MPKLCPLAAKGGLRRIVYLGGLGRGDDALSVHLRSRHAVGQALASTGVDVVELRAGVVIGAGSASFEMLRYLVDVLPIMVTPRWVTTRCQPIAISDILELLVQAITDGVFRRHLRGRWPRRRHLRRDDGPLRPGRRAPEAATHRGAGPDARALVALGGSGDTGAGPARP